MDPASLTKGGRRPVEPSIVPAAFTDRHGSAHPLDPELRTRLKPGWRTMLDPAALARVPDEAAMRRRAAGSAKVVATMQAVVESTTGRLPRGRIVEIGCYDGSATFELARVPGNVVVGTDLAHYYVVQSPGQPAETAIADRQAWLHELRERARSVAEFPPDAVTFLEDDVTASALAPNSCDCIVSFEVLEHVTDPAGALAAMTRLLRPGGLMYHDYNPFFSAIGGHSLCTLDFDWGHARLDDADFERYVREIRPDEADQALRFYRQSLNRMTLRDVREHVAAADLELLALVPWNERSRAERLTPEILREVRAVYPGVELEDLTGTFVTLVARRPA